MTTSHKGHSMKHMLWMLIGCLLPFLLIFLFPVLGASPGVTTLLFFVLMLGCHLMMLGGHGLGGGDEHDEGEHK